MRWPGRYARAPPPSVSPDPAPAPDAAAGMATPASAGAGAGAAARYAGAAAATPASARSAASSGGAASQGRRRTWAREPVVIKGQDGVSQPLSPGSSSVTGIARRSSASSIEQPHQQQQHASASGTASMPPPSTSSESCARGADAQQRRRRRWSPPSSLGDARRPPKPVAAAGASAAGAAVGADEVHGPTAASVVGVAAADASAGDAGHADELSFVVQHVHAPPAPAASGECAEGDGSDGGELEPLPADVVFLDEDGIAGARTRRQAARSAGARSSSVSQVQALLAERSQELTVTQHCFLLDAVRQMDEASARGDNVERVAARILRNAARLDRASVSLPAAAVPSASASSAAASSVATEPQSPPACVREPVGGVRRRLLAALRDGSERGGAHARDSSGDGVVSAPAARVTSTAAFATPDASAETASAIGHVQVRHTGALRAAGGVGGDDLVQQSLDSLAFFQQTHRGRLGWRPLAESHESGPGTALGEAVSGRVERCGASRERSFATADDTAAPTAPLVGLSGSLQPSEEPHGAVEVHESAAGIPAASSITERRSSSSSSGSSGSGTGAGEYEDDWDVQVDSDSELASGAAEIPVLPRGRVLSIDILTTWGDPYYVGLSAIDIFDGDGRAVQLRSPGEQVSADPPDVNSLPGYSADPRVVQNLFDGVSATCDDLHAWLAPFTPGQHHVIRIDLESDTVLGMLRIWNYNKSRVHAERGARHVEVRLDDRVVFRGELRRAPGTLENAAEGAESIVFTNDGDFLERTWRGTWPASGLVDEGEAIAVERPRTGADAAPRAADDGASAEASRASAPGAAEVLVLGDSDSDGEPSASTDADSAVTTAAREDDANATTDWSALWSQSLGSLALTRLLREYAAAEPEGSPSQAALGNASIDDGAARASASSAAAVSAVVARGRWTACDASASLSEAAMATAREQTDVLDLVLLDTWGDEHYVGLTGVQLLDSAGAAIDVPAACVSAEPRDLATEYGIDDPRVVTNVVSSRYDAPPDGMWLTPRRAGAAVRLRFALSACGVSTHVAALRVWNYNKGAEDALRGARWVRVDVNSVARGVVELRAAPGGAVDFDFGQLVPLAALWTIEDVEARVLELAARRAAMRSWVQTFDQQTYVVQPLPVGRLVHVRFVSAWGVGAGDAFVARIDLVDEFGALVAATSHGACGAAWRPPAASLAGAFLLVQGGPAAIGGVRVVNARGRCGVRDFQLVFDHRIVFAGVLPLLPDGDSDSEAEAEADGEADGGLTIAFMR